jgi:hypothetical protein
MLYTHAQGPDAPSPRADEDDDDDDHGGAPRAPMVESGKGERLNPPTEYKVVDLSGANLEAKLNELGEEGWALVATTPSFIFRRMKKVDEGKKKARVGFGIG